MDNDYGFGKMIYDDVGFHLFGDHYMSRIPTEFQFKQCQFLAVTALGSFPGKNPKKKKTQFFVCSKRFSTPGFSDIFALFSTLTSFLDIQFWWLKSPIKSPLNPYLTLFNHPILVASFRWGVGDSPLRGLSPAGPETSDGRMVMA